MREIKFRAWIHKDITQEDSGFMHYPNDNSDFRLISNGDGFSLLVDHKSWADESKFEVMQYTGLKDANGVEIYEGDIVGPCSNGWHWVIEWGSFGDTGFYGSNQINSCRRLEPSDYLDGGAIIEITESNVLQCAVIGNIHENKEFLK